MKYNHKLTGITLVRNGERLGYPYKECINSLLNLCDEVVVNTDPNFPNYDGTADEINNLRFSHPNGKNLIWFTSNWDMSNTGDGSELAKQANKILPYVIDSDWIIYLQADELIHEKDMHHLRTYLEKVPSSVSQVELFRTYFWKDLDTRAPEHELYLGRVFKSGTHTIGGDGMYLIREQGEVIRSLYTIYHYSRMGPEEKVIKRVKNLDSLFHDNIEDTPTFSYNTETTLVNFSGTHPQGIQEFYNKQEIE